MGEKKKKSANLTAAQPKPEAPASTPGAATPAADALLPFPERHPQAAKAIFVVVWIYVAMLWLLALDQMFHWGIFGPKVPPLP